MLKFRSPNKNKLMKKIIRRLILCFILAIFPLNVFAYGWDWGIKNFTVNIQINEDSSIRVIEHIEADFSRESHHGIFRFIPVKYVDTSGRHSSLRLKLINITDEKGKEWPFREDYQGDFINFKIGHPDRYINSVATFNITYDVEDAISSFSDHDELYWNATGDRWKVPIGQAQAVIKLPSQSNVEIKDLRAKCFSGQYGSKAQNCAAQIGDKKTFIYSAKTAVNGTALQGSEGLTVVAGFPKNIVTPQPLEKKLLWFFSDNWGFFIPVIVLLALFYQWHTKGRDPKIGKTAIMPFYKPPDDLTPGELGALIDEKVDIRDISAGIIDLAVRGYLKIVETVEKGWFNSKKYSFVLLKKDFNNDKTLQSHEKQTLTAIFEEGPQRELDDLNNKFYKDLPEIKENIYTQLVEKQYFPISPERIRGVYIFIGLGMIVCGIVFGITIYGLWLNPGLVYGLVLAGLIFMVFARFMPRKSKKGVETYYKILGLEEYIKTAEKDRLKFQEKENIFEKLLPYAMALGIADKWSKAFEGIYKTPPSWYQSNDPNFLNNFSTFYFLNSLNHLSSNMQTTFQSAPRSSGSGFGGGGFSGGGGGGGGGGAW